MSTRDSSGGTSTIADFALHLVVEDVPASLEFYERALGARVDRVLHLPNGSIATAQLDIDGLQVALAAPVPGTSLATPRSTATSVAAYRFTVPDAEAAMQRATSAGASGPAPGQGALWGVRTGEGLGPSGHRGGLDPRGGKRSVGGSGGPPPAGPGGN